MSITKRLRVLEFLEIKNRGGTYKLTLAVVVLSAISLALIASLLLYMAYNEIVFSQKASRIQREIEKVFREIRPLPGAISTQHNSIVKTNHGGVSEYYKTELNYTEIRSYYDEELAKKGWVFKKETKMLVWGQDLGGIHVLYCKDNAKDNISATIYYTGREEAQIGYTFSFGLNWGLTDCY